MTWDLLSWRIGSLSVGSLARIACALSLFCFAAFIYPKYSIRHIDYLGAFDQYKCKNYDSIKIFASDNETRKSQTNANCDSHNCLNIAFFEMLILCAARSVNKNFFALTFAHLDAGYLLSKTNLIQVARGPPLEL